MPWSTKEPRITSNEKWDNKTVKVTKVPNEIRQAEKDNKVALDKEFGPKEDKKCGK